MYGHRGILCIVNTFSNSSSSRRSSSSSSSICVNEHRKKSGKKVCDIKFLLDSK